MRRAPLWLRLVAGVLALVTVTLFVTGFAGTRLLRGYLVKQTEQRLMTTAERARMLQRPAPGPANRPRQELPSDFVVQSYSADGELLSTLDSGDQKPPDVKPGKLGQPFEKGDWLVVRVADPRGYLAVSVSLANVDRIVGRMTRINIGVSAAALLLLGLACWWLARSLGRMEADLLARQASERSALDTAERMRRFMGEASHELRTPVTTIRGYADMYQQQRPTLSDESTAQIMDRIGKQAVRMTGLVNDLLLLAQIDSGEQARTERQRVDLLDLAADIVLDDLSDRVTLDGVSTVVSGDPVRLRQAISNLVDNALRHTTGPVRVTVGPGYVDVADVGPGIPAEHADRVFDRFYRAGVARAAAQGGSGLGLAIVAGIAQAHGGRVSLESSEVGARFRLSLPVAG